MPTKRQRRSRARKQQVTATELEWLSGIEQPDSNPFAMLQLDYPTTEAAVLRCLELLNDYPEYTKGTGRVAEMENRLELLQAQQRSRAKNADQTHQS